MGTNKKGIRWFFYDFLASNGLWREFLEYLKIESIVPHFYWIHLIKCPTQNDKDNIRSDIPYCTKYLWEEIEKIKPQLIIGAGLIVAKTIMGKIKNFKDLIPYNQATLNKRISKRIIIPHPSFRSAYKNGEKGNLISVSVLKN